MKITEKRNNKYIQLANHRQQDWTVILENVSDWHNIGAVMRTCDAVGIGDLYVLYTDTSHRPDEIGLGKRTTAGTRKWVQVHYYEDMEQCFASVREKYKSIQCCWLFYHFRARISIWYGHFLFKKYSYSRQNN